MLPSTGYFKAINCPFYENGYCERPYCHFRHSRRDGASSSTVVTSETSQTLPKSQNAGATVTATNPDVIHHLVSEAVKKVLADQNLTDTENIVNKVVAGLKPTLPPVLSTTPLVKQEVVTPIIDPIIGKHTSVPVLSTIKPSSCVYNPTPIAELKKRHIPITAYEPTRESKAIKRKSPDRERPWMDVIRNISGLKESKASYTPTAISQISSTEKKTSIHSYVPANKSDSPLNLYDNNSSSKHSYIPEKKKKKESYHPKPKKRREEYVPRKPKVPLKNKQSLDDDSYNVFDDILCGSESNPSVIIDEESQDIIEVEPKLSDDEDVIAITSITKDDDEVEILVNKLSQNEKENDELKKKNQLNNENDDKDTDMLNKEKPSRHEESSKYGKEDTSKNESNSPEKSSKEDVKHNKHRENSKHGKSKNEDLKHSKSKEDDNKHSKNKEDDSKHRTKEDSKHSKSKDKDRGEDKKDKDKEKGKEKDKHKSSSRSNDKDRCSSSSKDRSKEKDKDKDKVKDSRGNSKDSTHRSKKDSKSDREKSSSLRDSKDTKKENKDKSSHKSDEKSRHKSKSSSSDSKSKSNKQSHKNSDKSGSHSSHKSSKSNEKRTETEDEISDRTEDKSDQDEKFDGPEYEQFSPFYDEQLLETDDSDHDVEEECRKIFQEYEISDHPKDMKSKAPPKPEAEEHEEITKKRVAHPSVLSTTMKQVGPVQPLKRLINPQQKMYDRWRMMREAAAAQAAERAAAAQAVENVALAKTAENTAAKKLLEEELRKKKLQEVLVKKSIEHSSIFHNDHQINGNGRIRIAQVPYAQSLALEKKKVLEQAKVETKTIAQTKKGGARVAHVPQIVPQLIRPEPLQTPNCTQKFPLNVRQFYLNAMQDICVQIYTSADNAAQRSVREEFACYERCKALNVYKNSCMLTVHRLRKEVDQKSGEPSNSYGTVSHETILAGKVKGSWSVIKPKKSVTNFKGISLYNMLSKWILTEQELRDNGFPRPHPDGPKGRAKLYVANVRGQSTISKVPNERYCCRCNKPFMVDKHGFTVKKENCIYHYARKFTFRGESKYMCCKQDGSADGCCDATTHVWDYVDLENLRGYVQTFDKENASAEEQGIFALDCEMCYTTQGLELTRVTVINEDCQVVYETLVKPSHPIIDFNTRFSGISEGDMKTVTTTLLDVQATLLSIFSSKTILIGHSLESDCKALKLLHATVVDTSVMFPHKNGPPFKRALKTLCSEYLRKIIQNELGGHDSKEDAVACMELVHWKVKEEAKLQ